jgi:hypothetical protein
LGCLLDDVVGGFGPDERLASFVPAVMKVSIALMRSLTDVKVPRRIAWRVMVPKKDLDHVQPGARGRREMQRDPLVLAQPCGDVVVLVGGVVVDDDVQLPMRIGLRDLLWYSEQRVRHEA